MSGEHRDRAPRREVFRRFPTGRAAEAKSARRERRRAAAFEKGATASKGGVHRRRVGIQRARPPGEVEEKRRKAGVPIDGNRAHASVLSF